MRIINWAACGEQGALVASLACKFRRGGGRGGGGGIFGKSEWGYAVQRSLILTLFQSNIYEVNVREYPPGIYVAKMNTVI